MDCSKTQRLLNDFTDGQLDPAIAQAVHQHIRECSDCRVSRQRALRLQQMLAIKRHETPSADYFDNFLGEFHQRLSTALVPQPSFWERMCLRLHVEPTPRLRYGFIHAFGVVCAIGLIWQTISTKELPVAEANPSDFDPRVPEFVVSHNPVPHSTPAMVAAALPARSTASVDTDRAWAPPAVAHPKVVRPRYVLDRLPLTPASHETADFSF